MASYASVAELREMLPQVAASAATDVLLGSLLERATLAVQGYMGFEFAGYGAATDRDVCCDRSGVWLRLPFHEIGSVTAVTVLDGRYTASETETTVAATDWQEESEGEHAGDVYYRDGWTAGQWYRVTSEWGYGDAPADVVQVVLELAVNLWRGRDRGMFSDVVGVEGGGAVGYSRALTNYQRMVLDGAHRRVFGVVVV